MVRKKDNLTRALMVGKSEVSQRKTSLKGGRVKPEGAGDVQKHEKKACAASHPPKPAASALRI